MDPPGVTPRPGSPTLTPDRFDLYERCVQAPDAMARMLAAIHGRAPRALRDDFCGGGGLCKAWLRMAAPTSQPGARRAAARHRAVGVDLDPEPLARLEGIPDLTIRCADVHRARDRADVIAALNFPLGYFHTRPALVAYLRLARRRLLPRGVFVADIYGGRSAFDRLTTRARFPLSRGAHVVYTWEQRDADIASARVRNALHFRVETPGRRARVLRDAFVYDWRLWSIPELTDAYTDAGFTRVEVYDQRAGALDEQGTLHVRPIESGDDLDDDWVVYVAGRR
ncbi:MAG: hypothetical protein SFY69_10105 [Planctomycetota bacterium]|nr:hypothetical protein [Planctomycetota bacterium]